MSTLQYYYNSSSNLTEAPIMLVSTYTTDSDLIRFKNYISVGPITETAAALPIITNYGGPCTFTIADNPQRQQVFSSLSIYESFNSLSASVYNSNGETYSSLLHPQFTISFGGSTARGVTVSDGFFHYTRITNTTNSSTWYGSTRTFGPYGPNVVYRSGTIYGEASVYNFFGAALLHHGFYSSTRTDGYSLGSKRKFFMSTTVGISQNASSNVGIWLKTK